MEHLQLRHPSVILVVEDDPLVRMISNDVLTDAGFSVIEACHAQEALQVLETCPQVSVVFTDIEMPGALNGLDLAGCIRQRWPQIGVIITSGRSSNAIPKGGCFVPKPFSAGTLVRQVEEAIRCCA